MTTSIAGYHLLMILSAVDFHFHAKEDIVIRDFLLHQFADDVNLDGELEIISNLSPSEWSNHFNIAMHNFFEKSNHQQQKTMFNFAVSLVKADNKITPEEHSYMQKFAIKYKLMQNISKN